ncbi:hypothetical protein TPHA_0A05460 [Tetrapisispora phaffii CBS 4417]|uniref:Protein kinase domain-containing protein n=1 Tax=Tetrapisispora phaffii (strain ATCC 24235 / CBS 4417 / NBRC 1672 / NRRL Y-8282 / UCD 70-5) TaxID=1071381 RepID=G8BNZ2_TETPH|nr:hypothetical protein TPHA_0A05460 [Tetrapisispora phaffii CBS 4417]CCE61620.1 hypothetical protein TPHA_0A05460 [Tetrapisispora phaffii CBS 4417]
MTQQMPDIDGRLNNETIECKYVIEVDSASEALSSNELSAERKNGFLGDGYFSIVKVCKNVSNNRLYAMKIVSKAAVGNRMEIIGREIHILKKLKDTIDHLEKYNIINNIKKKDAFRGYHHILQLFDHFETFDSIVLITQLCREIDLYEEIVANTVLNLKHKVIPYLACIISAIKFLHDNNIIHRDIKAENFFFRRKTSKTSEPNAHDLILGDFGLAINYLEDKKSLREYVGTLSYISPEIVACNILKGTKSTVDYGYGVDIWAIGVLTYFMAFGYMPFDCETDAETHECIQNGDYYKDQDCLENEKYEEVWDFLRLCFIVDINKRPTITELQSHSVVCSYFDISPTTKSKSSTHLLSLTNTGSIIKTRKSSNSIHSLKKPTKNVSNASLSSLNRSKNNSVESLKNKTLMKTLSMTTLNQINSYDKSTFVLLPKPLENDLMNGKLSEKPVANSVFSKNEQSFDASKLEKPLLSVKEEDSAIPSSLSLHSKDGSYSQNSSESLSDFGKLHLMSNTNKPIFEL